MGAAVDGSWGIGVGSDGRVIDYSSMRDPLLTAVMPILWISA